MKILLNSRSEARFKAFLWHALPRILRLISGLLAGVVVARHLGPQDFGALSFATMVAFWAAGLVQIGSLEVVTRNSAVCPETMEPLLRTITRLRLLGAISAAGLILLLNGWFWPGYRAMYAILALFPLTCVPDCVEAAFFGRSEFRAIAPLRVVTSLLGLGLRLWLAASGFGPEAFALATVVEGGCTALLFLLYRKRIPDLSKDGKPPPITPLLRQSLPIMASGLVVGFMMKMDQLLLQSLRPSIDLGYYYVVVRFFDTVGVLIPSFVASVLPDLARLQNTRADEYRKKMILIYRRSYQLGFLVALLSCLVAPWAVPIVFGAQYKPAVPVFMAYSFVFPSLVVGSVRAMEFVISNKNINHLLVSLALLPLQLGFCVAGIHWFGPMGLAAAMAVVGFISTTLFSLILPPLRESGAIQKKALGSLLRWGKD